MNMRAYIAVDVMTMDACFDLDVYAEESVEK
jgi:hypothetical protein